MSLPADDTERTRRDRLFTYKAPVLDLLDLEAPQPRASFPLELEDRHIPHSMILKRVKILPSLLSDLCANLDTYSRELDALPDDLFAVGEEDYIQMDGTDASELAHGRTAGASMTAMFVSSGLLVNMSDPDQFPCVMWAPLYPVLCENYVTQRVALQFLNPDTSTQGNVAMQRELAKYAQWLIPGMFFCTDGAALIKSMDGIDSADKEFPWKMDSHCTQMPPLHFEAPDAPSPVLALPGAGSHRRVRRSERIAANKDGLARRIPRSGTIQPVDWYECRDDYWPSPADYIQKVCLIPVFCLDAY